jgi:hypothetical protein
VHEQDRRFTLSGPAFRIDDEADVAQLVEQPIRNRQVTSSSLVVGSIFYAGLCEVCRFRWALFGPFLESDFSSSRIAAARRFWDFSLM